MSAICDKIGLAEMIDEHTGSMQNERIVSTGKAVKAIAMNIGCKSGMQVRDGS